MCRLLCFPLYCALFLYPAFFLEIIDNAYWKKDRQKLHGPSLHIIREVSFSLVGHVLLYLTWFIGTVVPITDVKLLCATKVVLNIICHECHGIWFNSNFFTWVSHFFIIAFFFQSDGIARSYTLASQYAKEAVRQINKVSPSPHRDALVKITQEVLKRRK